MIVQESSVSGMTPIIPPGFRPMTPEVKTASGTGRRIEALGMPVVSAPMWRIHRRAGSIRVTRPILVHVYAEGGFVFAENESLSICGTGSNQDEAIADFVLHILHFYDYYRQLSADKAMGEAARLKRLFCELFVEE